MSQQNTNNPRTPVNAVKQDNKTGVLGEHPVGVGLGAVGVGAAAGAAGGAIGGPIGAVAGAAVGAVVGAVAGNAAAEVVNPTVETEFWRGNYASRPYARPGSTFEQFAPAYRYGWESFSRRGDKGQAFDRVEADLGRGWDQARGESRLAWDQAKQATRDAWDRCESAAHDCCKPVAH